MTDAVYGMKEERDALADRIINDVTFLCSVEGARLSETDFEELRCQLAAMQEYYGVLVKRIRRYYARQGD